ncbi:host-nuclease inhibitor Gam family protein [Sphingopyxis granuli]|uniref:host-nuclease inhibitor Gam family protein n=1 Tax=Sphingopyxis granuli TaxID=267128 RepID=UPI001BAEC135|nr:host-nuclease inhibitor Gam family protein [Sphingopyxis granuli]QUM72170.1 host-nuclease inhibitor Gam family protein [Sphingopyxis granuli]
MAVPAELDRREWRAAVSRRKQPALAVPATDEEAIAMIAAYGDVERAIRTSAEKADAIASAAKAEHDTFVAEAAPLQREAFAALKSWWEAGGAGRMAGKRRSADLAGAKIGTRLGNKSVRLPRGTKIDAIVEYLRGLRWMGSSRFVRTKYSLDKDAIIAAWPDEADTRKVFEDKGVTVDQDDEFFIDVGPAPTLPPLSA